MGKSKVEEVRVNNKGKSEEIGVRVTCNEYK